MADEFKVPKGTAQGTSTQTKLVSESKDLGYSVYTMQTALERLYVITYGWGLPPIGYKNYAKGSIYFDSKNGEIYKMIGDEGSSLWGTLGSGAGGSSISQWVQLTDTPNSYTGFEGQGVRVKVDGTGLEFYDLPAVSEELFTTEEKNKLASIEENAQVNPPEVENNCLHQVLLVQAVDVSSSPVAIAGVSGNTVGVIVDNISDNGEHKSISNDYKYATTFNSGNNDVLNSVSVKLNLLNSPDGQLEVGIYSSNSGVPDSLLTSGIVQVNTLLNGENKINFSELPVSTNTEYVLVVGVGLNTQGTIQWLETNGGTPALVNINDEWLVTSSNLTHQVRGYLDLPNTGGFAPLEDGEGCFFGFSLDSGNEGDTVLTATCGKVCGFSDLSVGETYFLDNNGGITTDAYETKIMAGIAISSTCILIKQTCGRVTPEQDFHILTESGDEIMTEGGDNIDHSTETDGDQV